MYIITTRSGLIAAVIAFVLAVVSPAAPASAQPGQEDYPYSDSASTEFVETPVLDPWCTLGYSDVFYYSSPNRIAHKQWVSITLGNDGTYDAGFEADIMIARNNDAISEVGELPAKYLVRSKRMVEAGDNVSFTAMKVKNDKWLRAGKGAKLFKVKKNGKLKRVKKARVHRDDVVIPDIRALDNTLECGPSWIYFRRLSAIQMR